MDRPVAEVCALAKRDLKKGEKLDFIGEYCYRSWAMRADEARDEQAIPVGLLENGIMKQDITMGTLLTRRNCNVDETSTLYKMRKLQDEALGY